MGFRVKLWLIAVCTFGLDRGLKWLIASHMTPGQSVPLIGHVVSITYVLNSGAAFGLLSHRDTLFIVVAGALLVGVVWLTATRKTLPGAVVWGLGLLAGGAAGNLWDRMVSGRVVDYVNFHFWPVFNAADSAIVIGMAFILVEYWNRGSDDAKQSSAAPSRPVEEPREDSRR